MRALPLPHAAPLLCPLPQCLLLRCLCRVNERRAAPVRCSVINSVIVKSSKLTRATKVYRGIAGGLLPDRFWEANEQGVKGGIESALMSTTFDRAVAMHYASVPGKPALVFEMQVGGAAPPEATCAATARMSGALSRRWA